MGSKPQNASTFVSYDNWYYTIPYNKYTKKKRRNEKIFKRVIDKFNKSTNKIKNSYANSKY